jgi:hypothetical protein
MRDINQLFTSLVKDLQELLKLRGELKEIFTEYHTAMARINADASEQSSQTRRRAEA